MKKIVLLALLTGGMLLNFTNSFACGHHGCLRRHVVVRRVINVRRPCCGMRRFRMWGRWNRAWIRYQRPYFAARQTHPRFVFAF